MSELQDIAVAEDSRVNKIWINPNAGTDKLSAGEAVYLGQLEYWSAEPPKAENWGTKTDQIDAVDGIVSAQNNADFNIEYIGSADYEDGAPAAEFTITETGAAKQMPNVVYNVRSDATGWKNWYIKENADGYLRIWIKAEKAYDVRISVQETSPAYASYDYSVSLTEELTGAFVPIDLPLSELQGIAPDDSSTITKLFVSTGRDS